MSIQCSKSPLVDWFWLINAIISLISLISFDGLELELPEQTTDLPLATDKLYHKKLYRVHLTTYKNLTTLLLKYTKKCFMQSFEFIQIAFFFTSSL